MEIELASGNDFLDYTFVLVDPPVYTGQFVQRFTGFRSDPVPPPDDFYTCSLMMKLLDDSGGVSSVVRASYNTYMSVEDDIWHFKRRRRCHSTFSMAPLQAADS